jgi:hypothetical protein
MKLGEMVLKGQKEQEAELHNLLTELVKKSGDKIISCASKGESSLWDRSIEAKRLHSTYSSRVRKTSGLKIEYNGETVDCSLYDIGVLVSWYANALKCLDTSAVKGKEAEVTTPAYPLAPQKKPDFDFDL